MGLISFELPEGGQNRGSAENRVKTGLSKLKELVNGNIDHANLSSSAEVKDTQLASPNNSTYRMIFSGGVQLASEAAAGTYVLAMVGSNTVSGGSIGGGPGVAFPLAKADYEVAGKTQKMRLRAMVLTNATKPTLKFTIGLYPLTVGGGTNELAFTLGAVVSGSAVEINEPAASNPTSAAGSDFAAPADGTYALGVVTSAKVPANARMEVWAALQTRNV